MVKAAVASAHTFLGDVVDYIPPGAVLFLAAGMIADGAYLKEFRAEVTGVLLMIGFTFSAGTWIGEGDLRIAWSSHFLGMLASDYFSDGPHVNPAMSLAMYALGQVSYTEMYVRAAGQMFGGLLAFPLFHAVSNYFQIKPFGGPEYRMDEDDIATAEAFVSEFCATFILCWAIYILNMEIHFGKYHSLIKTSLTAVTIRALIEIFPTAGPAMNPMLATAWAVFGVGKTFEFPQEQEHYFVYWLGPCVAALLASFTYVVYAGGTFLGAKLPIGPLKPKRTAAKAQKQD